MSDDLETGLESECSVCYAAHDDEIHQATLSIHDWFHHQVTHDFEEDSTYLPVYVAGLVTALPSRIFNR